MDERPPRQEPRATPTPDDGHAPCWHRELHPIAHNHGQFQQGTPVTPLAPVSVLVCCWCNAQVQETTPPGPVPTTHTGATTDLQRTPGES